MVQSKNIDVYKQWIEIPKKAVELESIVNEPGINSYLRAWFLFRDEFLPEFSLSLHIFGETDNQDIFWKFLSRSCLCNLHYLQLMSDLQHHIQESGVVTFGSSMKLQENTMTFLINLCLNLAASEHEPTDDKIIALTMLTDFVINMKLGQQDQERVVESVIHQLKLHAKSKKSAGLRIASVTLLFSLLDFFASVRHKNAPTLYKALTWILIEFYFNQEMREEVLQKFIKFFQNNTAIPMQIVCEPLLEQLKINISTSKNRTTQKTSQSQIISHSEL
jgi:hypothetical protein